LLGTLIDEFPAAEALLANILAKDVALLVLAVVLHLSLAQSEDVVKLSELYLNSFHLDLLLSTKQLLLVDILELLDAFLQLFLPFLPFIFSVLYVVLVHLIQKTVIASQHSSC